MTGNRGAGVVVCAPLRTERLALRSARTRVIRTGMGQARSTASGARRTGAGVLVAGVAGGLGDMVRPGDVVVATEVRGPAGQLVHIPTAPLLAGTLRALGLTVHLGPIESRPRVVDGVARRELAASEALAVDTESVWLAPAAGTAFAVVRAIVDTADAPLMRPGTVIRGITALRNLHRAVPALDAWAAAIGPHDVLLDGPSPWRCGVDDAADCDLLLVVGSRRQVEGAEPDSVTARLVRDAGDVDLRLLAGAARIRITAGGAAAPHLVDDLVRCIRGLGRLTVTEPAGVPENLHVTLSKEVS